MPTHSSAKPAVAWARGEISDDVIYRIERDLDVEDNGSTIESGGGGCMLAPVESQPSVRRRGEDVR